MGRYIVLELVGRGGTGEVYRAYDPQLDRRVAIKVLSGLRDEDVAQAHLLCEARALAKLSHPRVVGVYDVGVHHSRVFIAMEYVEGSTLDVWCKQEHRRWRELVAVLIGAGRGLAAAHGQGVVHRDFKPTNVLVDASGRVFVADFGLARAPRPPMGFAAEATASGDREVAPPGTPGYLAPELYEGAEPDARSDIYAFAVSAWEVLFGQRPWHGPGEAELLAAKREGPPAFPGGIPRAIGEVVRRALAADPNRRPASMDEVLRTLERGLRARRGLWLAGTVGVIGMGVVMATGGSDPPCLDAAASVGEIWHASARETAREGLIAHGGVFGADAWSRAEDSLQVYIDAIAAARTEACEATHVRREQSPQLQDLQVACLDRRLHDVKVLLEVFARANTEVSTRAVSAVGNLEPVETCSRQALAQDVFEPLPDEGTRTLRTEIDRARVLESTAQYDEAMDVVRAASRTVERQGSPALVLELEYRRGRLQDRLGDHEAAIETLSQVHWEAEALGLDDVAAQAAVGVVYDLAAVAHRTDEALVWAPHARAAIERAGGDEALRATLLENIGTAHLYGQAHEEALRMYEEALVIRERRASEEPLGLLSILGSMGVLLEEMHRYEEAKQVQERALALSKLTVGDQHPHTGRSHDNLGTVLMRLERHAEAIEELGIGLDIRRNALGERHPLVGLSYGHLGLTWLLSGEGEKAVDAYERALSIVEEANAADARIVLQTREGLAHALVLAGRSAEAEPHARAALEGLRAQLGEAHPEVEGLAALLTEIAAGPQ